MAVVRVFNHFTDVSGAEFGNFSINTQILNGDGYSEVADMNTDGVVDILDVILIVNIILQN